jgi:hypothetical protein
MALVGKPLESITIVDLQALIDVGARETAVLEFKGSLPLPAIRGGPTVDRWIEKGDRVGDYARDQLLAEIVAFSNADGGTLILGLHETKDEPRSAESLAPLPNCEGLAKRLLDAAEDIIEPRLSAMAVRGLPINDTGEGYVLIRTGKSLFGPHRLTTTREFYIRRGERTAKMTAREIRDHSYNLARAGDQVRHIFDQRLKDAAKQFELLRVDSKAGAEPLLIRVTAAPMSPQYIDGLTSRPQLWWTGNEFTMKLDGNDFNCNSPARDFGRPPAFRLRSFVYEDWRWDRNFSRQLNSEGVVEFTLSLPRRESERNDGSKNSRAYYGWIFSLVVGAFAQIRHLQSSLAWDAIDFGLNVSVLGCPPLSIHWADDWMHESLTVKNEIPLCLPQYEVNGTTNVDELLSSIVRDISNACGIYLTVICRVPTSAIASSTGW